MEDKIIEVINHVRNKNKQRVTKERIFNYITKPKGLIDQGQLMEDFKSTKDNGVIFSKPKAKQESYFATNKNNNSWIISNKSPTKVKTVTSPELVSPSSTDEILIFDNAMLLVKSNNQVQLQFPKHLKPLPIKQENFLNSICLPMTCSSRKK